MRWSAIENAARRLVPRRPFLIDGRRVGSVALADDAALAAWPQWLALRDDGWHLDAAADERSAALAHINAALRAQGRILAWRDETYAIVDRPGATPLALIERASARFWGTLTFGAHCNGYVADAEGRPTHLWIARRAAHKATDPGKLDNLVGGGVPHGQTPFEALLREGLEEAGLDAATMRGAATGPVLDVHCDIVEGRMHEHLHTFDLRLPADVQPCNQDGEVAELHCMPVADAIECAAAGEMTLDAALVTLDFALRHHLLPAQERDEVAARMAVLARFHDPGRVSSPAPGRPGSSAATALRPDRPPLDGITVFERGWLSSNNILLHGRGDGEPATLVDASHCLHAAQTVALVERALRPGESLATVVNTHLHSDHCGGNAALQRSFRARLLIPPGEADAVARWDEERLSYRATGQRIARYAHDAVLPPQTTFSVGHRAWTALSAPGHDPHSLILFDVRDGVLISADALWADGFGVVFPELDGEQAFDDVAAVLDLIERLAPRRVIPGHGAPFDDVAGAMQRARTRLARFAAEPLRHARHAAKVLVKYHLLEERAQPLPVFRRWWADTPLAQRIWQRIGHPEGSVEAWGESLVRELVASGALALDVTGMVHDR